MATIMVNVNNANYTLTNDPLPAGVVPIGGPQLLGLSKALAEAANNRGEYFGLVIVGSPGQGVDQIAQAIRSGQIAVY